MGVFLWGLQRICYSRIYSRLNVFSYHCNCWLQMVTLLADTPASKNRYLSSLDQLMMIGFIDVLHSGNPFALLCGREAVCRYCHESPICELFNWYCFKQSLRLRGGTVEFAMLSVNLTLGPDPPLFPRTLRCRSVPWGWCCLSVPSRRDAAPPPPLGVAKPMASLTLRLMRPCALQRRVLRLGSALPLSPTRPTERCWQSPNPWICWGMLLRGMWSSRTALQRTMSVNPAACVPLGCRRPWQGVR